MGTAASPAKYAGTLFEKLGGASNIEAVVEKFYARVLTDPELQPFFAKTNMTWLKMRQVQFFTQALGGPAIYKGKPMREAHVQMKIENKHFELVAKHLTETLRSMGVAESHVEKVLDLVVPLGGDIVNSGPHK